MGEMIDIVICFLNTDEWLYHQTEDEPVFQMSFQGHHGKLTCYAHVDEAHFLFSFYSISPIYVPEEKRTAIAEFITRANYSTKIGNFEMDFSDGEVRFKTSIDVENDRLSQALISNLVYANVWMMDYYLPGMLSVIYGGISPLEALENLSDAEESEQS